MSREARDTDKRRRRLGPTPWVAMALCLMALTARAQDRRAGTKKLLLDFTPRFKATGTLTTTDVGNDGLGPAPPTYTVQDENGQAWRFRIGHRLLRWGVAFPGWPPGVIGVRFCLDGTHVTGPHRSDEFNNALPLHCSPHQNVPFGQLRNFFAFKGVSHDTVDANGRLSPVKHWDYYAAKGKFKPVADRRGSQVTGEYAMAAKHFLGQEVPTLKAIGLGSSWRSGSLASYDHASGRLRLFVGDIDILDLDGGRSVAIHAAYAGDPVSRATLLVSDLSYLGQQPNGQFKFGDGRVEIVDNAGQFQFVGTFPEYTFDDGAAEGPASYAWLDSLGISDVADESDGPSHFLDDFVDVNGLGVDLPPEIAADVGGIVLSIETSPSLAEATLGFTQSAELPATVVIAAGAAGGADHCEPCEQARLVAAVLSGRRSGLDSSHACFDVLAAERPTPRCCDNLEALLPTLPGAPSLPTSHPCLLPR